MSELTSNKPKGKAKHKAKAFKPEMQNRAAKVAISKSRNRYNYGENNLLPNELLAAIEASVTATACRDRKQEFIEGRGIKDQSGAEFMVNPEQTADDLVMELADVTGIFDGHAVVVKYDLNGLPARVYAKDWELIRRTDDGRFYYTDKIERDQPKDRKYMVPFDPDEKPSDRIARVRSQIEEYGEQLGDIIYSFGMKAGQKVYPIPTAWAAMEEIESDAALGRLDHRNIKKGFRPGVILTTVGIMDDETKDENLKTERDYFDDDVEAFTGEDAAEILHMEVEHMDQKPQIDTFDQEKVLNSTTEAADRNAKRVCRGMQVPHVLIPGFAQSGQLGNVQEMLNTIKLFQQTIGRKQRMITRTLSRVWPDQDWTIEPLNLIEDLPDWLLNTMTTNEKRLLGGLEETPTPEPQAE